MRKCFASRTRATIAVAALLQLSACGGDGPASSTPSRIEIVPASPALLVGESTRLRARVLTRSGQPLTGQSVTWESLDGDIVAVQQTGDVRGLKPGVATVRATAAGVAGSVDVAVAPGPEIALSEATVTFTAARNGAAPAPAEVEITNAGDGNLRGLAADVTYADGEPSGWLTLQLQDTVAPTALTLAAAHATLEEGTYSATVVVRSPVAAGEPELDVVLTVTEPAPAIGLAATRVSFSAAQGEPDPAARTIEVTNAGGGTLSGLTAAVAYASGQPQGWLTATVDAAAPGSLTLQPHVGALVAGVYTATVSVSSPAADNSPQKVTVTFSVGAPVARIQLDRTELSFAGISHGIDPAPQQIAITNSGAAPLTGLTTSVSYGSGASGWLLRALSSANAPATLTIGVELDSLPAGTYTAEVAIASSAAVNSPRTVTVTVDVEEAPPTIRLSPTSLMFATSTAAANPSPADVQVTNSGGGTLEGLHSEISYTAGQPAGWLDAQLLSTSAPTTLRLQVDKSGLPAGTFTARVRVGAGDADVTPREVAVTLSLALAAPAAPSDLHAISTSAWQVVLGWTDNSTSETGFRVQRSSDGTSFSTLTTTAANATVHADTSVIEGSEYYYQVRSCTGDACSAPTTALHVTTPSAPPTTPTVITASIISSRIVEIAWSGAKGHIDEYRIERRLGSEGEFTQVGVRSGTDSQFRDAGLSAGTLYNYRIRACNDQGCSPYSATVPATTLSDG